jgi:hypothetical protein
MNYVPSGPGQTTALAKPGGLGVAILVFLFGLPFAGFGLFALATGIKLIATGGNTNSAIGGLVFGIVFLAVGLGLMAAAVWGWKKMNQDAATQARYANRPWMARTDWAEGKIKPASTVPVKFYLFWSLLVLAISVPALFQIPKAFHKHEPGILIVLVFPLVACYLLIQAFISWRASRRFGNCFFEPAQTPTPLGGVLEGMIQTGKPIKLEHDLYLKCSCIRRTVSGCGKERHVTEIPLWQDEKIYKADAVLPEPEPGHSSIPVHFKLPADQPECYSEGEESIFWRLEARTKMRGLGFHIAFDVPVFKVAGAAIAETDDSAADDPTAALQARMEDVRRDEHSRIRVSDGPNGREFYFPAARNVGACLMVTLMTLLFSGISVLTWYSHAPLIFPIAFGCFGLLLTFFTLNAWLKSSRVTIDSSGVQATNHWLFFRRSRHFNASDVERFDLSIGTTSGTRTFWNIKLIRRGQSTFQENKARFEQTGQRPPLRWPPANVGAVTLASDIADRAEAAWLVQQMTKALNRLESQGQVFTVR